MLSLISRLLQTQPTSTLRHGSTGRSIGKWSCRRRVPLWPTRRRDGLDFSAPFPYGHAHDEADAGRAGGSAAWGSRSSPVKVMPRHLKDMKFLVLFVGSIAFTFLALKYFPVPYLWMCLCWLSYFMFFTFITKKSSYKAIWFNFGHLSKQGKSS